MIRIYSVIFSPKARRDALALMELIAEDRGPVVALNYIERLEACCMSLRTFPQRGHMDAISSPGLRTIGFERRVTIHFRISGDQVIIARLLYAGRQP